jgi:hypothetical protein
VNIISKQYFIFFFSLARERAFMSKNIKAGFAVNSLFLFNPDKVLKYIQKPFVNLNILKANKVKVGLVCKI